MIMHVSIKDKGITTPPISHFAHCQHGSTVYVHGGIEKRGSVNPVCTLLQLDFEKMQVVKLQVSGSPYLAFHCAFGTADSKEIWLVGGFDGRNRTSDVYHFDTRGSEVTKCITKGFPSGGGLSSHTVTPCSSTDSAIVIGRLAGLRMQRTSASTLLLKRIPNTLIFNYELLGYVDSRSGHSANTIGDHTIRLAGGRQTDSKRIEPTAWSSHNSLLEKGISSRLQFPKGPRSQKGISRKYHASVNGERNVIIHGGESFNTADRDPLSDVILFDPSGSQMVLPTSQPLYGHGMVNIYDRLFAFGGFGRRFRPNSCIYEFEFST